jgi:hypothetical protein
MLLEGFLNVGVPVVPGVPAWVFLIGMRDPTGFEKCMKPAVATEEVVIGPTVEREARHGVWIKLIHERIVIEISRVV